MTDGFPRDEDDLFTIRQVCEFFGGKTSPIDSTTIYRWIREGRLAKPVKYLAPGKKWGISRWRLSDCVVAQKRMGETARP